MACIYGKKRSQECTSEFWISFYLFPIFTDYLCITSVQNGSCDALVILLKLVKNIMIQCIFENFSEDSSRSETQLQSTLACTRAKPRGWLCWAALPGYRRALCRDVCQQTAKAGQLWTHASVLISPHALETSFVSYYHCYYSLSLSLHLATFFAFKLYIM